MSQLALDVAPPRAYTCCGEPCGPVACSQAESENFPHSEDCPNPNIGTWLDRHNRPIRRLWCGDTPRLGGPCPYGGKRPDGEKCCKVLAG